MSHDRSGPSTEPCCTESHSDSGVIHIMKTRHFVVACSSVVSFSSIHVQWACL